MFDFLNPQIIIPAVGLFGICFIIFAESGLFFGFFLPGDTLLFIAGIFAAQGHFNIILLIVLTFISAVIGDQVGYLFGKRMGPRIFRKEESFFFHKDHIVRAQQFYEKYGVMTIILARFVPIVRTFAPIVAGVGNMKYRTFTLFNMIGGFVWTSSLSLVGYFFGSQIPNIDAYVLPIILFVILGSFVPLLVTLLKKKKK